jgi:hypothetical protein
MRAASEGKRSKDFVFMPQSLALSGLETKKVKFSRKYAVLLIY